MTRTYLAIVCGAAAICLACGDARPLLAPGPDAGPSHPTATNLPTSGTEGRPARRTNGGGPPVIAPPLSPLPFPGPDHPPRVHEPLPSPAPTPQPSPEPPPPAPAPGPPTTPTPTPTSSIEMAVSPPSAVVDKGARVMFTVTLTSRGGFTGNVTLEATHLPPGQPLPDTGWSRSIVTLSPGSTLTTTFTFQTDTSSKPGTFTITIVATTAAGKISRDLVVTIRGI